MTKIVSPPCIPPLYHDPMNKMLTIESFELKPFGKLPSFKILEQDFWQLEKKDKE